MGEENRSPARAVRRAGGRVLRRVGLRPPLSQPWVVAEEQPRRPQPLESFRLFAIIGAWMEEDVIAATVTNAFTQGCERVYIVDNDSTDNTVREAEAAGAVLAESFSTEQYDEMLRLEIMNRVVDDVSRAAGDEHIWWLWLDADEFPHAPHGRTVREHLELLDRRFRIVGARFINHFPDREPGYVTGFHPLDFQPLCEEHPLQMCALGHRKHSLQRFDRSGAVITSLRGFHLAESADRPLREPTEAIYLHHFPYRDERVTRARLALLCGTDAAGNQRVIEDDDAADAMLSRFRTLDAVYTQDWERVRNYQVDLDIARADPLPWTTLVPAEDAPVKRWYPVSERARGL